MNTTELVYLLRSQLWDILIKCYRWLNMDHQTYHRYKLYMLGYSIYAISMTI